MITNINIEPMTLILSGMLLIGLFLIGKGVFQICRRLSIKVTYRDPSDTCRRYVTAWRWRWSKLPIDWKWLDEVDQNLN